MNVLFVVTSADTLAPGCPTGVWLEEYAVPYCALTEVGIAVTVASPKGGPAPVDARSAPDEKSALAWRDAIEALASTAKLAEVSETGFDALYIPGGHGPMVDLAGDGKMRALVEAFDRAGKIIAAICHGPTALLVASGADGQSFLKGRKATAFTNGEEIMAGLDKTVPFLLETRMRAAGALFQHTLLPGACHVVTDKNLITGQNPASSLAMAKTLSEALAARQRAALEASATAL